MSITHIWDCIPKHPKGSTLAESWILIPAYAWQVKLSVEHKTKLNAFEELILKLLKNGTYTNDQLVKMTYLHEDLIEWIRTDLNNYNRPFNGDFTEEKEESNRDLIGWVLQDPETGGIYPYFASNFQAVKNDEEPIAHKLISLEFGDDDQCCERKARLLQHPNQLPMVPDVENIIEVLNRKNHKEFKARLKNLESVVPSKFIKPPRGKPLKNKFIHRVTFMGDTPTKVWLPTAGVVMKNGSQWFMCDPVGTGWSEQLKLRMERFENEGDQTATQLIKYLCSRTTYSESSHGIDLKQNQQLARQRLTSAFGSRIFDFQGVVKQMEAFFESWLILENYGDKESINEIEAVCGRSRKVLEALFKELATQNPLVGLDSILVGKNENIHFDIVKTGAIKMGYSEDKLPKKVINVRKSWLKKEALDVSNFYSLSSVIGGLLLQAGTQEDHPIRIVAKKAPDLFREFESIIELGNPASHDNSHKPKDKQTASVEEALSLKDKLIRVISLLLDPEDQLFNQNITNNVQKKEKKQ